MHTIVFIALLYIIITTCTYIKAVNIFSNLYLSLLTAHTRWNQSILTGFDMKGRPVSRGIINYKQLYIGRGFSAYFGKRSLVILGIFIDKNAQYENFCINKMVHFEKILCALILLNQFILLYQYTEINTS